MKKIILAVLISCAASANAGYYTGYDLKRWAGSDNRFANTTRRPVVDGVDMGRLVGYVAGVADSKQGQAFCLGTQPVIGDLTAIVKRFVRNHPRRWEEPADVLVTDALQQAYPCAR